MYICSVKYQPRHPVPCQRAQGRCGRHEGGRQADRPGHRPDTADAPEQMGSPLADLRDAVLCRGPGHRGPGVRLHPGWAGPRSLQARCRRGRHVALREMGGHARAGAGGHTYADGPVYRQCSAQAGPGRPPDNQTQGKCPEAPVRGLREALNRPSRTGTSARVGRHNDLRAGPGLQGGVAGARGREYRQARPQIPPFHHVPVDGSVRPPH